MKTWFKGGAGALQLYAALVIVTGASVVWLRLPSVRLDQPLLFWALLVGSAIISALKVHLPLGRGNATLSMSYITDFLALVLLGVDQAMLIAGTSGATQCLLMTRGRPTIAQTLFSAATLVITMQVTGLVANALGGLSPHQPVLDLGQVSLLAAAAFFLVNSGLVSIVVALARREPIGKTWYDNFFWTAPACFIGAAIAVLLSHAPAAYIWVLALAAGPLYVTFRAYRIYLGRLEEQERHLKEVSDLHLASVEALARAIDARDQTIEPTRGGDNHIRRVQAQAVALAEAAGLPAPEVEAVRVAALLHDIGKLAVPEHILTKPGRLTPKEFARVRIHPIVGAEIIKAVPFPYPVAPVIQSHHERWDGSGYPDGLRGEAIPIGARVLAVVDYFDALTSARPYHAAADRRDAIATLKAEAGQALDPRLVDLFLGNLETNDRSLSDRGRAHVPAIASRAGGVPVTGFAEERRRSEASWVFQNISLATQEMRGLYDIAQTLGTRLSVEDTMAILTAKLNRLVPGSCWALFLHDADDDIIRCRFATGLAADVIREMVLPSGEGTSGWVARHRTPVLNGRAAADFEAAAAVEAGRPFQSALSYPLVDGDALVGILTAYHVDAAPYCEAHRHVLDHVSSQAASVLRNTLAFERMRDVSLTDPLTELSNARALAAFLRERFTDTPHDTAPSALIMIDLDDFKAVNDRHGHQIGDAALQAVATAIRAHVRQSDFCARCGGDEFVVVLNGCDRLEGERRAREVQHAVSRVRLATHGGAAVRLGISIGVAMFPEDATTIPLLIASADRRMYGDKATRRDAAESVASSLSG